MEGQRRSSFLEPPFFSPLRRDTPALGQIFQKPIAKGKVRYEDLLKMTMAYNDERERKKTEKDKKSREDKCNSQLSSGSSEEQQKSVG